MNDEMLLHKEIDVKYNNLSPISDHTENDTIKLVQVMEQVEWVINNIRLRYFILGYRHYQNKKFVDGFAQTTKINSWHLRQFVEANERGKFEVDYEWDLEIEFYFKKNRVIACTSTGSEIININRKYWDRPIYKVANTFIHEMCHVYGMKHSYKKSWLWPYSAPYAIGNEAEELIKERLGIIDETPTPQPVSGWRRFKRKVYWLYRRLF